MSQYRDIELDREIWRRQADALERIAAALERYTPRAAAQSMSVRGVFCYSIATLPRRADLPQNCAIKLSDARNTRIDGYGVVDEFGYLTLYP